MANTPVERTAFETWAANKLFSIEKSSDGTYAHVRVREMWQAWQARAAAGVKVDSTPFSDFIRNATPEEKAEVYGKVMDKVAEQQRAVTDAADGVPGTLKEQPKC